MSDFYKPSTTRTFLSFGAVAAVSAAAVVAAIWAFGPVPYSETNPYPDAVAQNPTGAGSNPEGAVTKTEDGVIQYVEPGEIIDGSAATNVGTVEDVDDTDTVVDESNRLLEPSEANSADEGDISDRTGQVIADDD